MLLTLLLSASAPVAATSPRIEQDAAAVERAAAALAPHVDDTAFDGKPGTGRLAEAQWLAVQRWAADWLDRHRDDPEGLAKAGARFGDAWTISARRLGRGDVLVSVSRNQVGNVFILGSTGGGYRLRWSVADRQRRLNPAADRALAGWRPEIQNGFCPHCQLVGSSATGRLPDAADGAVRFWIEAGYAQMMGATIGRQLSLWSWHGGRARPLLVHDFAIMADQASPVMRGSTLYVPSKGQWDSVYACGSCFGHVIDLRYAIGPNRVRALPPVSRTPEVDLVDRVFSRVLGGRPAGAIASPSALRVIRIQLADHLTETGPLKRSFGMVMGWKRWRSHGERRACLYVDGAGAMAFAFDAGISRITSAQGIDAKTCQGKGASM
jgi:hypothetical protein